MPYVIAALVVLVVAFSVIGWRLQRKLLQLSQAVESLRAELAERPLMPAVAPVTPAVEHEPYRPVDDPRHDGVPPVVITALGSEPEPVPVRRVAVVSLGTPLVKMAAFSYALRHSFNEETRVRANVTMHRELKRQRRLHRKAHRGTRSSPVDTERQRGWVS